MSFRVPALFRRNRWFLHKVSVFFAAGISFPGAPLPVRASSEAPPAFFVSAADPATPRSRRAQGIQFTAPPSTAADPKRPGKMGSAPPIPAGAVVASAGTREPNRLSPKGSQRAAALALYYKARRLEDAGREEDALAVYLELAGTEARRGLLQNRILSLYTRTGKRPEAAALLEKNLAAFPREPGTWLELSRFWNRNHDGDPLLQEKSLKLARQAARKFPESASCCDHLVRLLLERQDRKGAQAIVDTALGSKSKDPWFWIPLSTTARHAYPLDDRDTREKHYAIVSRGIRRALELAPENLSVQRAAADFFAANGAHAEALEQYQQIAGKDPGDLGTKRKLGQLLRLAGRFEEAVELFESLVAIDPGDAMSHQALVSLYETSDPDQSLTHRAEVLRLENGDPRDYTATTVELLKAARPVEALTLVRRGIFFNPGAASLLYLQARVQSENGKLEDALRSLEQAETLAQEKQPRLLDSAFYYSWGSTAQKAGKTAEAEKYFRLSIEKAPRGKPASAAPAYNDLGFLWLSENRNMEAAGDLLRTANRLVPDHAPFLDSLGWWHFQRKEYEAAATLLRKAVELAQPSPPPELLEHLASAEAAAGLPAPGAAPGG